MHEFYILQGTVVTFFRSGDEVQHHVFMHSAFSLFYVPVD